MQPLLDWNDLRFFEAVRREGSLAGAARALGVEHTTVGRRIAALERALGARLFTRTPEGLVATAEGDDIAPLVDEVAARVREIEARASGADARLEGTVKLATSAGFTGFLVKRLGALRERHPRLVVEVLSGNAALDISRREADLAIRLMPVMQPDVIAKKLGEAGWGLYASDAYLARAGRPKALGDLSGHDVVAFDASLAQTPGGKWLDAHLGGANVVLRGNSLLSALNACIVGMGIAALPALLVLDDASVVRLFPDSIGSREIYLLMHAEAAKIARVRAVIDFVVDAVTADADRIR